MHQKHTAPGQRVSFCEGYSSVWFDSQSSSLCDGHLEETVKEDGGGAEAGLCCGSKTPLVFLFRMIYYKIYGPAWTK